MKKYILYLVFLFSFISVYSQKTDSRIVTSLRNKYNYTGEYKTIFSSGIIKDIKNYKNGKLDGVCQLFNEKGVKIGEGLYKDNKKDGMWRIWDDDGVLRYEMYYSKGIRIGIWRSWNANGLLIREIKYSK